MSKKGVSYQFLLKCGPKWGRKGHSMGFLYKNGPKMCQKMAFAADFA